MPLKISSIQSFTMHDGPGIRTTFFLSGCPLKCIWCHNPEAREQKPVLIYDRTLCIGCGLCADCPRGVHRFRETHEIRRENCTGCRSCVERCPAAALSLSVRTLSDEDFYREAEKNRRVAKERGGITFSGGEPLVQGKEIVRLLENTSIRAAIETCGYADPGLFSQVISRMDYIMFDLKLADPAAHLKYTGVDNALIFKNLEILRKSGKAYVIRTPLIPNITDTPENLTAIQKIVGSDPWEKLPYNPMTGAKYERIGMEYPL